MFQCQLSLITMLIAYRQSSLMFIKGECTGNAASSPDWRSAVYQRKETGELSPLLEPSSWSKEDT